MSGTLSADQQARQHPTRLLCPFDFPTCGFVPLQRRRKSSLGIAASGQRPPVMAKKKGTKRGRQAEAAAAQDIYEAEDEQPAEERPNKASKRYDVSATRMPGTLPTHKAGCPVPPALPLSRPEHQLSCAREAMFEPSEQEERSGEQPVPVPSHHAGSVHAIHKYPSRNIVALRRPSTTTSSSWRRTSRTRRSTRRRLSRRRTRSCTQACLAQQTPERRVASRTC